MAHVQIRVCSGKPTTIVASIIGFYPAGKCLLVSHTLVGLLQQISRVFDAIFEWSLQNQGQSCGQETAIGTLDGYIKALNLDVKRVVYYLNTTGPFPSCRPNTIYSLRKHFFIPNPG